MDTGNGGHPIVATPWAERLQDLLVPVLRYRIQQLGLDGSGAYNFYGARVERGGIFSDYDLALTNKLLGCGLGIRKVHEIGCGFGQLVFLLGWNGFNAVGYEADRGRARTARYVRDVLNVIDRDLTSNVDLLEGEFPSCALSPDRATLVLTTNLVATRSRLQQLAVLEAMRRYPFVLADIQRFFDLKPGVEEEPAVLAKFAEAGLRDGRLFLDMGASGRYYLFANPA